jgi:hypothetical protein
MDNNGITGIDGVGNGGLQPQSDPPDWSIFIGASDGRHAAEQIDVPRLSGAEHLLRH